MTSSIERSTFAVYAFALMPGSYLWLIMGGGITRSLGLLFGILSLLSVWYMFTSLKVKYLLLSILLCSITILCHPETAWFVFFTSILIGIFYGLNKKGIQFAAVTLLGVLILTSPWWIAITQRHSLSLFFNTMQAGNFFSVSVALFYFTSEPYVSIFAVLAIFGLFAELVRRRFFLFVWMLLIMLLSARSGETFATIPGSILVGSGVVWVLIPGLQSYKQMSGDNQLLPQIMNEGISKLVLSFLLVLAIIAAMANPSLKGTEITSLSQYDHAAMEWISANTSSDSQFAVLTGEKRWGLDPISEWFPALSNRISVSTVQGSEWLPDDRFTTHIERYDQLQSCTNKDFSCVNTWARNNNISFSYIYVNKPKMGDEIINLPITQSIMTSDQLQLVFDNPRASVYRVDESP
jgi:hypothetical protein